MEPLTGDSGTILKTTDGGNNWVPQSSGTANMLFGVSFIDANTGTAVGGSCGIGGESTILRTTDGGGTWINQANPGTICLFKVSLTDANSWNRCRRRRLDSPEQPTVAKTEHDKASWNNQNLFIAFSFTDTNNGTISGFELGEDRHHMSERRMVEAAGLNRTRNYSLPQGANAFYAVSLTDTNAGHLVGDAGIILQTTDGGTQWNSQPTATFNFLYRRFILQFEHGNCRRL